MAGLPVETRPALPGRWKAPRVSRGSSDRRGRADRKQLSTEDGRLFGKPDLVIKTGARHQIVDYKSGAVTDEDAQPREAYVHQLQLYAFLEFNVTGAWPQTAHLFPSTAPLSKSTSVLKPALRAREPRSRRCRHSTRSFRAPNRHLPHQIRAAGAPLRPSAMLSGQAATRAGLQLSRRRRDEWFSCTRRRWAGRQLEWMLSPDRYRWRKQS